MLNRDTAANPLPALAIGARVRHARLAKGLRLQEVAAQAGCSKSMLSKIESDKVAPSLATLQRIAGALDIQLASLFAPSPERDDVVRRAGERPVVEVDPLRHSNGIRYERLVPFGQGVLLEANIHVIAEGGGREDTIQHPGEELGLVLEGRLELKVQGKTHLLNVNDSFFFNSSFGHAYRNPGPGFARVIWINTPPVH
jgi:transcriptional regulator with XRE-family HTH domain